MTHVATPLTIGIDLGDKYSHFCFLDQASNVAEEGRVTTSATAFRRKFDRVEPCVIAMEAGTHSPWLSRLLTECGHTVLVAHPRKLRAIYENDAKSDKVDAEMLARIARLDPKLLSPIHHRSEATQTSLATLRTRRGAIEARTKLVNTVRGVCKSLGVRLPSCKTEVFHEKVKDHVPEDLTPAIFPLLDAIARLSEVIDQFNTKVAKTAKEDSATRLLTGIPGIGPITAFAFTLTIEDPNRFKHSRSVPVYIGLTPKRDQSGKTDKQLKITKAGDPYLRSLLIEAAQWTLGPFGKDSDLRRWGLELAARGGKNGKKRAVVGVARKLAVLMHAIWLTGETYAPFHHSQAKASDQVKA